MTTHSYNCAKKLIETISLRYEANFNSKSIDTWAKELQDYSVDDLQKAYSRFKQEYESLPYRFSVAAGLLKQLKPTLTTATVEERLYTALKSQNPYEFLRNISPKLEQLASSGNVFEKGQTITSLGFAIKDVAKRFIEWNANKQKGFVQSEPKQKAIETQDKQELKRMVSPFIGMTDEQRKAKTLEILKLSQDKTNE